MKDEDTVSAERTEPALDVDAADPDSASDADAIVLATAQQAVDGGQDLAPRMPPTRAARWRKARAGESEPEKPQLPWVPDEGAVASALVAPASEGPTGDDVVFGDARRGFIEAEESARAGDPDQVRESTEPPVASVHDAEDDSATPPQAAASPEQVDTPAPPALRLPEGVTEVRPRRRLGRPARPGSAPKPPSTAEQAVAGTASLAGPTLAPPIDAGDDVDAMRKAAITRATQGLAAAAERAAAEQEAAARAAAEKATRELAAAEKAAEAERVAAERLAQEQRALESAAAAERAAAERAARVEVAATERLAAENAAAARAVEAEKEAVARAEAERRAADQAAVAEREAHERALAERAAAEQADIAAQASADRAAADLAAQSRARLAEAASAAREVAERAAADQAVAEQDATRQRAAAEASAAALAAEAERLAAERVAAERRAAEQAAEAERLASERAAAERLAAEQAAEAERLAGERLAAERAARQRASEAEQFASLRLEAERRAAEEAALAEEAAAARRAAEEAAREDLERRVVEENSRLAAAQLAAQEQAEREAAHAEKVRAEEARRAAERAEEERLAAERAEVEALAAAEAERLAAEDAEAQRLAAEQAAAEAERLAAEDAKAQRLAAEQAEALAAEAEAQRLATERAEAERLAAEEGERLAGDEAEQDSASGAERSVGAHALPLAPKEPEEDDLRVPAARHRIGETAGLGVLAAAFDRSATEQTDASGDLAAVDATAVPPAVPAELAAPLESVVLDDDVAARAIAGMRRPKAPLLDDADLAAQPSRVETPLGTVDFGRRGPSPMLNGLLQLVLLALALTGCYLAYQNPTRINLGVAGALSLLLLIVAFRSPAGPTRLRITDGILDIHAGQSRYKFDLANPRVQLEMPYPPTSRRWRILIHRTGMAPFVVDASMADPQQFTEVMRQFRPNL